MTDDPFLNPNPGGMRPAEPSGQPSAAPPPTQVQPSAPPIPPPPSGYQTQAAAPGAPPPPPSGYAQPGYAQQPYAGQQYAQPGYAQPGYAAYPPPPGAYGASYPKNWMGIASLICSIATPIVGISMIAGIIFGHMGLSAAKRGEANNRGLSLAGLIIGYVFLGLTIALVILIVALVATAPDYTYSEY